MKKLTSSLMITIILSGCGQIAYKQYGQGIAHKVGYSDFEIGENQYKVIYTGGVDDDSQQIIKYAYKRAKELCIEKGFNEYKTSNPSNSLKSVEAYTGGSIYKMGTKSQTIYSLDVLCK